MQAIAQPVALAKLLGMLTSWARSRRDRTGAAAVLALFLGSASAQEEAVPHSGQPLMSLDVRSFRPVDGPSSGPEVYYSVISADSDGTFLRGGYHPGLETVTMGIEVPEQARRSARRLRWRWRAFVNHFAKGNPHADIPDLVGVAVMTDGDQTNSESGADWSGFEIVY
jgi:hypothetical protein